MHRINGPGHVNNTFVYEDASINRPPTELTADWLNQVQAEIVGVIEAAGMLPDASAQIVSALYKLWVFDAVPGTYKGDVITVRLPHLRMMVWDAALGKYVRAPWHLPGLLTYSYDNPASLLGHLPVRGDVTYQQSNYPDLAARLGLSGTGTFALLEARGEFLRVLDNGRGVDVARILGSAQVAQIATHSHLLPTGATGSAGNPLWGVSDAYWERVVGGANFSPSPSYPTEVAITAGIDYTPAGVTKGETTYPRNIAYPLWVSY